MNEELKERYIQGKLSEEERIAFELTLADDPDFAKEVAFEIGLKSGIEDLSHQATKDFLKDVEAESTTSYSSSKWWYAAAGLVFLAISYFTLVKESEQKLFDRYYSVPQQYIVNVERGEEVDLSTKEKAYWHYDNKEYQQAQSLFLKLLQDQADNSYHFYLGICYLQLDDAKKAIAQWSNINDPRLNAEVLWYSALAYLKLEDKDRAKDTLSELLKNKSDYQAEATLLLEDLK